MLAVVSYGCVWPVILRRLGGPVPSDALGVFLQSQLGKYLPGSVWHYAGRVGLARTRGVPARTTIASLGVEVSASALAAAAVSVAVLPSPLGPLVALGLVGLVLAAFVLARARRLELIGRLGRRLPLGDEALRGLPQTVLLYVPVWVLYGIALWLTARAVVPVPVTDVVFYTGTFALGWLAGMAVVFAPGGIGVREAVLVALLGPKIGHAEALLVAALSRVLLTSADLGGGAVAFGLSRRDGNRGRRPTSQASSGRAAP